MVKLLTLVSFILVPVFFSGCAAHRVSSPPPAQIRKLTAGNTVGIIIRVLNKNRTALGAPPDGLARFIVKTAKQNQISPLLVVAVIKVETHFICAAVSCTDAKGLMQIEPATAKDISVKTGISGNIFNPFVNIQLGTAYLSHLIRVFGSKKKALTAYNEGPTRVIRLGLNDSAYAKQVLFLYEKLKKIRLKISSTRFQRL